MRRFAKLAACVVASLAFIGALITWQHASAQYYDGNPCPSVDPPDHEVRFANPDDCASYFLCSNGIPILQRCPEGLHYNANLDVCDLPQDAGCADVPEGDFPLENHYLSCVDGGIETVVVPKGGTFTILGVTMSGNAGATVTVVWERWQCKAAAGHKCNHSEEGVKIQ